MDASEQGLRPIEVDKSAKEKVGERVMSDFALSDAPTTGEVDRRVALARLRVVDAVFHRLTWSAALVVLLLLGGVIISLIYGSLPAIRAFGLDFLFSQAWNPVTDNFGALAAIVGTVTTSLIAMLVAVPVGLGIAMFLTELCPHPLRRPIGMAIELLAGIPSIIYGIWGLFVLAPFLQEHVQPALISAFADTPVLSTMFAGPPYGIGTLTAGTSSSASWCCRSSPRFRAMSSTPSRPCSRRRRPALAARHGKSCVMS